MKLRTLTISALLALLGAALAQTPVSYTLTPSMAEYTANHIIDVGDVPGHQVRVFELVWDMAEHDNPPIFNGVKAVKKVQHAFSDYTSSTGHFNGYEQYHLENGDIIYTRYGGTVHTVFNEDGSAARSSTQAVHELVSGTGAFEGIRGLLRSSLTAEPTPEGTFTFTEVTVEGSYWMPDQVMGGQ